ncbi:hypothetical protein LTR50_007433 [Elasticomyces elasticus]|nr:hypothetical protein LTR50_007433 [Elasticomyces elasticus]
MASFPSGFAYSDLDQGAFANYRIINHAFAYRIPDPIPSIHAGPLMCAGASVFEALDAAKIRPGNRVGVVGVGGLGHVGILFARAMGCPVTALNRTTKRMSDAFALGADTYFALENLNTPHYPPTDARSKSAPRPGNAGIDVLLITTNVVPNLDSLLPLLARRATSVLMTIQTEALSVPYMPFVLPGHKLIASTEASVTNHYKMLEFVAQKVVTTGVVNILPWVEQFEMSVDGLAKAFERLEGGEMRFRGVLVMPESGI